MKKFIIILFITITSLAFSQVTFWMEEETDDYTTFYTLNYDSDVSFSGFQLVVNGASNITQYGGTIPEIPFIILANDSAMIAFSLTMQLFPSGNETLFQFTSDTIPMENGISGVLVVNSEGMPIECTNGCTTTDFHCNSGECLAENLTCDQSNNCADNSDELYCNDFTECEGNFDILYVVQLVYFILGIEEQVCIGSDLNENGLISISDVVMLLNLIMNNGGESGCTDLEACNFNPDATNDDGSCLYFDCNGECGGTAYEDMCGDCDSNPENDCLDGNCSGIWGSEDHLDECGVCCGGETGVECSFWNSEYDFGGAYDCNGDCFGFAYMECGVCCGGNTGHDECGYDIDCNGDCFGDAFINECGCVGGNTGLEPDFCFHQVQLTFGTVTGNQNGQDGTIEILVDNFDGFTITNFSFNISNINITGVHGNSGFQFFGISNEGTISSMGLPQPIVLPGPIVQISFDQVYQEITCITNCEFQTEEGITLDCGDFMDCYPLIPAGCTDPIAQNWDPNVEFNDGSCDYSNLNSGDLQFLQDFIDINGLGMDPMELEEAVWENNRLVEFDPYWSGTLPESIGNLDSLRIMTISTGYIPYTFGNLGALRRLSINSYYPDELTELPEEFGNLSNLRQLFLNNCAFTQLPESFGNLTNLTTLGLTSLSLQTLPESFGELLSLDSLHIGETELSIIPDSFGNLANLSFLEIIGAPIESLPDGFCNLDSLIEMHVRGTELATLPDCFGSIETLRELDLTMNELTSLPNSIGEFQQLEILDLSFNNLISVPESIGDLTTTSNISLNFNQISSLPASICFIPSLTTLAIGWNQLISLPDNFGEFDLLQNLGIDHNHLTSLPESFIGLTDNLHSVSLGANMLYCDGDEIDLSLIPEYLLDGSIPNVGGLYNQHCEPVIQMWYEIEVTNDESNLFGNVYYYSDAPFSGWQFVISGSTNLELLGHAPIEDNGFVLSASDSTIVGYSITGSEIPASGYDYLFSFTADGIIGELSALIVSDQFGNPLIVENDCDTDEYQCGNEQCITSDLLCNYTDDCGDNWDEYFCSNNVNWIACNEFDITDVISIVEFLLNPAASVDLCDNINLIDQDGVINILDVLSIVNMILETDLEHFTNILNGYEEDYIEFNDNTGLGIMPIYILNAGEGVDIGDEIGLFDYNGIIGPGDCPGEFGSVLVGATVYESDPFDLLAYGAVFDCDEVGVLPGFIGGNEIIVIIWDSSRGIEFEGVFEDGPEFTNSFTPDDQVLTVSVDFSSLTLGDMNFDSQIDVLDIVTVVNVIVGNHEPDSLEIFVSDMNGDATTDVLDIVMSVSVILGG
ncbi:MAG: hypothetical protein HQ510_04560 [Candidatus Marinimicrobia bacterium]|nr:hypothetical protein [Candidatus Neomarinimicrobiota bacterium]